MKIINMILFLIILHMNLLSQTTQEPPLVILYMIDGLHWEAPEKLDMPILNSLIKEGTYIQKSYVIVPHHPTIGDYSKYNSCSFPNPMLHQGTIFLKQENKMIQETISPEYKTAFVVNTTAYRSVSRGFTISIMDPSLTDDQVVDQGIRLLENQDINFMRIHLQTPGNMGVSVYSTDPDEPYYRNIWSKESPYAASIENADKLLGQIISYLKGSGRWENTILIVTSDHGQSDFGWHSLFDEDSWVTPMVFTGPGIARDRELSYFEHTDLAPTIAWLLDVDAPNTDGGAGKLVKAIMKDFDATHYNPPMFIKTINQQIKSYNILHSRMILAIEKEGYFSNIVAFMEREPFYHQDRITDWHKAGSTENLIKVNADILKDMQMILDQDINY
jgi:hypothetical protein